MEKLEILRLLKISKSIKQLRQVHCHAITSGILNHYPLLPNILYTITSLVTSKLTSSCRQILMKYASCVLFHIRNPTAFCYNTMMRAQILVSSPTDAIFLFINMRRLSITPDFHTFPFVFKACGHLRALSLASALHTQAFKFGFVYDLFVLNSIIHVYSISDCLRHACRLFEESSHKDIISYNSLIDGFVKAGDIYQARQIFDSMQARDAVSWGTLMAGYAQMKQCNEAIDLFNKMLSSSGLRPDNVALVSALSATAHLGDLEQGIAIHKYIINEKRHIDSFLSTSLVDFYAKCGCIDTALEIFESSTDKNLYTWNVMLVGLAMHGHGTTSLDFFYRMIESGIQPDGVTLLGVLVGCSHGGLVSEARKLFEDMEVVYGVPRELKHYGCMADLFGRAGLVSEALQMVETMPNGGDVYVWGALLAGCRVHGLVGIAEKAARQVYKLKPEDSGSYSVMANIYANAELWDDVVKVRSLLKDKQVKRSAGYSLIKVNGASHEFVAGVSLHPQFGALPILIATWKDTCYLKGLHP